MTADAAEPTPARKRTGRGVRASARPEVRKSKRTLVLSDEAWERLTIHAGRQKTDKSAVVEELLSAQLRRYVVQDRGREKWDPSEGREDLPVETLPVGEDVAPSPDDAGPAAAGGGEGRDESRPARGRRRAG